MVFLMLLVETRGDDSPYKTVVKMLHAFRSQRTVRKLPPLSSFQGSYLHSIDSNCMPVWREREPCHHLINSTQNKCESEFAPGYVGLVLILPV